MGAKLNLDFYSGEDFYSDGDIEDEILEIVRSGRDYEDILLNDNRWAVLYHLSPIRHNIINWYPFKDNSSCLEIGGGCGAITEALCKKLKSVKVVELSKRRATINYTRHQNYENLEIIVGNLNDIEFNEKFDYITLNGVLEYAGAFTETDNPYQDFLEQIKRYLKPNGKLIVAIENRYGLKYFAGAMEDHTAKIFDGITGYQNNSSVRTFGKVELEELLRDSGYRTQEFFYPHPDYKMPLEIFSDSYLPNHHTQLSPSPNFDSEKYDLFNETEAFKGIIKNRQFPFFANSFLVICGE